MQLLEQELVVLVWWMLETRNLVSAVWKMAFHTETQGNTDFI